MKNDMKERQALVDKIHQFLNVRVESRRGGWAEVSDKDMDDLESIIDGLIDLKCDLDADGDSTIRFQLINRRKTQSLSYRPLPYYWTMDTAKEMKPARELALYNLNIAMGDFKAVEQQIDYAEREEAKEAAKIAEQAKLVKPDGTENVFIKAFETHLNLFPEEFKELRWIDGHDEIDAEQALAEMKKGTEVGREILKQLVLGSLTIFNHKKKKAS